MKKTSDVVKLSVGASDSVKQLELEIAVLEKELREVETKVNAFENVIRTQLHNQIIQIRTLSQLYKNQKKAKKLKRLEQKKRGKNYQEPKGIVVQKSNEVEVHHTENQQELKRLYKEAIVKVHPDKFQNEEESEKATELTIELIDIYKSGDLEKLMVFHEHIVTGNAMSYAAFKTNVLPDPKSMLVYLGKKKEQVLEQLETLKQSYTYTVLTTYPDPNTFLVELKQQFNQRIIQLQKRTR